MVRDPLVLAHTGHIQVNRADIESYSCQEITITKFKEKEET